MDQLTNFAKGIGWAIMYDACRDRHDGQQLPADLKTHHTYREIGTKW
ncbi:MAG: hypothetical protein GYB31_15535 [Bacteroidetes bacterium]|nr:hypothetical protein [Bacteroidota bacterium]